MTDTVTLPILDLSEDQGVRLFMATKDQRFALVRRACEGLPEPPGGSPWGEEPLRLWCWFVLKANELDVDPDVHHPLIHWGIDLGFSSTETRRWVWTIS